MIITFVGGSGRSLVALRQSDGGVVWQSGDFANGQSSPLLIEIGGRLQVVAFLSGEVAGFDPDTGDQLWVYPHKTSYGLNISMPVWNGAGTLLVSSGYGTDSRP